MDSKIYRYVQLVVQSLFESENGHTATKFVSPNLVVHATRVLSLGKLTPKNQKQEVMLTIGRPNVKQKKFISDCKKAGVNFPVPYVQIRPVPVKRKK